MKEFNNQTAMKTGITHTVTILFITLLLGVGTALGQSGTWTKKANSISGTWTITEKNGKKTLALKGFKTATAPDLKIFLSPETSAKVSSRTATKGSVFVAKLKSTRGDQSYPLPSGIQLSKYKSVIIHCEKYSKLWGVGKL